MSLDQLGEFADRHVQPVVGNRQRSTVTQLNYQPVPVSARPWIVPQHVEVIDLAPHDAATGGAAQKVAGCDRNALLIKRKRGFLLTHP